MSLQNQKRVVTVIGATGAQGSSVIASLLRNPDFVLRGTTRNPDSDASRKLSTQGVELFKLDVTNPGPGLDRAFEGAWAVYLNLPSESPEIGKKEFEIGKAVVDAIEKCGVKNIVYSTLPDAAGITNGKVPIPTFDEKFKIQQYILTRGFETACFIAGGWYFENFYWSKLSGGFPFEPETNATGEEVYTIRYPSWGPPSAKLAFVAMQDDFGDFVHGMLLDPQKWNGKVVLAASGLLSWPELIDGFEKYTGKKGRFAEVPLDEYEIPEAPHVAKMFEFYGYDAKCRGDKEGLRIAQELKRAVADKVGGNAELTGWEEWMRKYVSLPKE